MTRFFMKHGLGCAMCSSIVSQLEVMPTYNQIIQIIKLDLKRNRNIAIGRLIAFVKNLADRNCDFERFTYAVRAKLSRPECQIEL